MVKFDRFVYIKVDYEFIHFGFSHRLYDEYIINLS